MSRRVKFILFCVILVLTFCFILLLNYNTEFVTDDFIYQFVFEGRYPNPATRLISSPLDIFISMANHWRLWGGRVTIHFLLQLAFYLGRNFFDIFNTLMFLLLGLLIYLHITNSNKIKLLLLIIIYSAIFLFVPQPGSTIFWKSGSANYLWSSVLMLLMTYIFKRHLDDENNIKDNKPTRYLLLLFGLFIGCANENSGCALLISMILFMIFYKTKYKKIPKWCYFAFTGTLISYIFLLVSPGNYIRIEDMYPDTRYTFVSIINNFFKVTNNTNKYLGIILIVTLLTSIVVFEKKDTFKKYIEEYGSQIIFIIYSFISIYSLVLSPYVPERCFMFAFVYLVIVIGLNINCMEKNNKYKKYITKGFVLFAFILSFNALCAYYNAYTDIVKTKSCVLNHANQISEDKKNGYTDIIVSPIAKPTSKYNAFTSNGYLTYSPDAWTNRWIAQYYGVNSIVARKKTSSD